MGNQDNLTNQTFKELAVKWKKSLAEVKLDVYNALVKDAVDENDDLKLAFVKAAAAWGQSVEEAYRESLLLLRDELNK